MRENVAEAGMFCFRSGVNRLAADLTRWTIESCPFSNRGWVTQRLEGVAAGQESDLFQLFSAAGRKMGGGPERVAGTPPDLRPLVSTCWRSEDLMRVAGLVCGFGRLEGARQGEVLIDLYFRGSAQEKRAVLLALPALDPAERWLELAVEACRTNTVIVFEAIACENVFPSRYFTEAQLNQLVLKALFLGLDVRRIVDLKRRITPRLLDDLSAFASERRAAGREVPEGVDWIRTEATRT